MKIGRFMRTTLGKSHRMYIIILAGTLWLMALVYLQQIITQKPKKVMVLQEYSWEKYTGAKLSANETLPFDSLRPLKNRYPFNFTLLPKDYCTVRVTPAPFILAAVISAPQNFESRRMIRETWGDPEIYAKTGIRPAFFLGQTQNQTIQQDITKEHEQYGDIVQSDYVDSYKNLTLKSIAVLKWTSLYCTNAPFLLKIDDNVFLHSYRLTRYLLDYKSNYPTKPQILCHSYGMEKNRRVIRNPNNRWSVLPSEYPNYTREYHPEFCSGIAYILTSDLAAPFYNASLDTTFLFLEDVFITGLLQETLNKSYIRDMSEAYHIQYVNILKDLYVWISEVVFGRIVFDTDTNVVFDHKDSDENMQKHYDIWIAIKKEETGLL